MDALNKEQGVGPMSFNILTTFSKHNKLVSVVATVIYLNKYSTSSSTCMPNNIEV